jgi:hypothetical protein
MSVYRVIIHRPDHWTARVTRSSPMNAIIAYMKVSSTIRVGRMPGDQSGELLARLVEQTMKCSPPR